MPVPLFQHPELDGSAFHWHKGKIGILLIHGFTATSVEVRTLARFLFEKGYTVSGPLLPGHGTTPEDLNQQKWESWVEAAENSFNELSRECDQVFVGGESMGAVISLWLAAQHHNISGLLLFAPAIQVNSLGLSRFLSPFIPYLNKKNNDDSMLWQGYTVNPLKAATQFFKLQTIVKSQLKTISQPTLILQGKLDTTIDPESAQIVYDSIVSKDKKILWLANSTHCILLDKEFEFAAQECEKFIQRLSSK